MKRFFSCLLLGLLLVSLLCGCASRAADPRESITRALQSAGYDVFYPTTIRIGGSDISVLRLSANKDKEFIDICYVPKEDVFTQISDLYQRNYPWEMIGVADDRTIVAATQTALQDSQMDTDGFTWMTR